MPVLNGFLGWPIFSTDIGDNIDITKPNISRDTVIGISVAISGNCIISLALNCQKLAHLRLEAERQAKREAAQDQHTPERDEESEESYFAIAERPSRVHPSVSRSESEPLLGSSGRRQCDDVKPNRSFLYRLWRGQPPDARRVDHAHVDVLHITGSAEGTPNGHNTKSNSPGDPHAGNESDYLKSKLWWLGFMLMNIGEMGNFISYAFAPASIVAPLGTFALIANCFFAPLMLGERFRKIDFLGIVVAIIGAVTVVLSANTSDTRLGPDELIEAITKRAFIIYASIYIAGVIVLSGLSQAPIGRRHVFVDVGLCALFGGFTVLSTKAVSTLLTMEWFQIFTHWITYPVIAILIGTGVGQIRYLNRALMRFDSKIVVPAQFVLFNLSAITGSAILYGDFEKATFHQIVTFLYGCGFTFIGVFLITWAPRAPPDKPHESEETSEQGEEEETESADTQDGRRNVRFGSLSHRPGPAVLVPDGPASYPTTPNITNKPSVVSMIGLTSAQRVLLVHTPPRDGMTRPLPSDVENQGASSPMRTPDSFRRRRAISWLGDDAARGSIHRSPRIVYARSTIPSREGSRVREDNSSETER